ncbi:MAG: hypothetical protein WCB78_21715 [Pseudolabrys sp.]
MKLSGAVLALCIVPLCASRAFAQAPSPWPTSPQQAPAASGGFSTPQQAPAAPGGFSSPQQAPAASQHGGPQQMPPCVQEFFKLRDDAEKKAAAIKAANDRKAPPKEACVLFTALANSQTKMLKFANENGSWCGIPANVIEQIKLGTAKVTEIRTKVCQVAAAPPRPQGPSLSDALSAPVPDSNNIKTGRGTFDTLTGSPLGNK